MGLESPSKIQDPQMKFDAFKNGKCLKGKKNGRLPAMGWNSWNAFGTGNTEKLTKAMADALVNLGLDKLGYKYVVLDDGCYRSQRVDGKLASDEVKFPSGFMAMSDYVHSKGLKFGMYNDIGPKLCSGLEVGTCGHEKEDGRSYIEWKIDYLKVDNCYYLWDNATFSNPENARFVYTPNIKSVSVVVATPAAFKNTFSACEGVLTGECAKVCELKSGEKYVNGLGTLDGTNTGTSPLNDRSSELHFEIEAPAAGDYEVRIEYATGREPGVGEWLELAVDSDGLTEYFYDDLLPPTKDKESFVESDPIKIRLAAGKNVLRIMNHRRQENTLDSYAAMLDGLTSADPNQDIVFSICEWGKTHPQNWGYKVGNSWRILNDITFKVGSDGDPGVGSWKDPGTPSITSQYNKAVVMDEFAGLDKGWNDPDMLMIGMNGLTPVQNKTHFTLWCMMNSPLMLGLDLRRMSVGDELYNIIANRELIALNQDALGVQAKRIWTSADCKGESPDKIYIEDIDRIDILAKPLADGSIAVCFINVSETRKSGSFAVDDKLLSKIFSDRFKCSQKYQIKDLWTGKEWENTTGKFEVTELDACDNVTIKILRGV